MRLVKALMAGVCLSAPAPLYAQTPMEAALKKLDPTSRMMQVCDISGLATFARDKTLVRVDRVRVDAISPPRIDHALVAGNGGALRSGGDWFGFSFSCTIGADGLKATSFTYKVGQKIPKDQWEEHNLW